MKLKIENKAVIDQENTNNLILISGFGCFLSLLTFCICMINIADDDLEDQQSITDKSSAEFAFISAMICGAIAIISGSIYLSEATRKSNDRADILELTKNLFAEPGQVALQAFTEANLLGEDAYQQGE